MSSMGSNLSNISTNTDDISNNLGKSTEEMKYLREFEQQKEINRFTTAEIKVELGGITNNVNEKQDLDGIVNYIVDSVDEAMSKMAEGA